MTAAYADAEFEAALRRRGIVPPRPIIADGKLHRCDAEGKSGKGDAAYILFDDGVPAGGLQNWRDGKGWENWRAELDRKFTAVERAAFERRMEEARRQRDADERQRKADAAKKATTIWGIADTVVNGHPYLAKKGVGPHGVRLYRGSLVVPLCDLNGELHSLQFIDAEGGKRFLTGGRKAGCCYCIGDIGNGGIVVIAEGFATAATVHEATGYVTVVAFDAGNLPAVAEAVRQRSPTAQIVIAADDDYRTLGNPGRTKAAEAAQFAGGEVAVPDFGSDRPDGLTDFNDLGCFSGVDRVREIINAAVGGATATTVPIITVVSGERHAAADAGIDALVAAGVPFYQRDRIVRVCQIPAKAIGGGTTLTPGIVEVTPAYLSRSLGVAAQWQRVNRKGDLVRIDPPREVVEQICEMGGEWPFPVLSGVTGTPTMRPDGTLLLEEGYDPATGLVLIGPPSLPPIAEQPTKADADAALGQLNALLNEFPFRTSTDRAVALSELLTPVLRGAMPAAPMHLVNAPQAGTGKSYLAEIASAIATGERCAVVAFSPDPKETEKRLIAHALAGYPLLALDNVSGDLEGDFLCQITERPLLQLRPLGTSNLIRVANAFTVLANGNNAVVAADMVRRTIQCELDANMEAPETRSFRGDPLACVNRARGTYIAAALTIARAYICAGQPERLVPLPSYEGWSDLVRSALVWLGCADPAASMATLRQSDPALVERSKVFNSWAKTLNTGDAYLVAELAERAREVDAVELHDAFLEVARNRSAPVVDPLRLAWWLRKAENTVAAGLKWTCDRSDTARPRWSLNWV